MMIDLTQIELLKDLTTIEFYNSFIDLHNDYQCTKIRFESENRTISFLFQPQVPDPVKKDIKILFEEATIINFQVNLKFSKDSSTLDSFYRGRYEKNGEIIEFTDQKKVIFYVEFYEGDIFTIFAKRVTLGLNTM